MEHHFALPYVILSHFLNQGTERPSHVSTNSQSGLRIGPKGAEIYPLQFKESIPQHAKDFVLPLVGVVSRELPQLPLISTALLLTGLPTNRGKTQWLSNFGVLRPFCDRPTMAQ
jgi:hypothetical protein